MNCQEFESLVVDLVRGEAVDSVLGTRCWAHASSCSRCAELLLDQEKLTAGLEALATRTEQIPAPERIERALRTEFRAHGAKLRDDAVGLAFASKSVRPVGMASSRLAWAMAAAATLLVVTAVTIAKWRQGSTLPSMAQNQTAGQNGPAAPAARQQPKPQGAASQQHSQAPATKKTSPSSTPGTTRPPLERKSNSKTHPSNRVRQNPDDVLATDFIWLPYGSGLTLDDGWAMIRVTMPRSELASLGMPASPLSSEQASAELLKADVVLGQDGLARAIRFVE